MATHISNQMKKSTSEKILIVEYYLNLWKSLEFNKRREHYFETQLTGEVSSNSALHQEAGITANEDMHHLECALKRRDAERMDLEYKSWVERYSLPTRVAADEVAGMLSELEFFPTFSIVMPTYNSNIEFLSRAIESTLRQAYPFWELCIADDGSTDPAVIATIKQYAIQDSRIKASLSTGRSGISAASNSAINFSKGDWVCFLDHDDELHPFALAKFSISINRNRDWKFIYSDEDKLSFSGQRYSPHFKPDYNYELLLSQNYFCHLSCVQRNMISEVGGFQSKFDGAQDYDFFLRVVEKLNPNQIGHIPEILYHWRASPTSTAYSQETKPEAMERGSWAVAEHLERMGRSAKVSSHGIYNRIEFGISDPCPLVSIVIPTKNKKEILEKCINSIIKSTLYRNYEIIIVDNGSNEDDAIAYLNHLKSSQENQIHIIRAAFEFNFSKLVNIGVNSARGSIITLLNNDTEIICENWLTEMVSIAILPTTGAVGAKLLYTNGLVQHAGVTLGIGGVAGHAHKLIGRDDGGYFGRANLLHHVGAVTGACLTIRRELWDLVKGFDEQLKVAFNDVDFCLKVGQKGYKNIYTPHATLFHHESISRGYEDTPDKVDRFQGEVDLMINRWGTMLQSDPSFSPNLSLLSENFELSFPPRIFSTSSKQRIDR